MMKHLMIAMFTTFGSVISAAQTAALSSSDHFPLMAHIKRVEMEQRQLVFQGTGRTINGHVMIAEINGHTYGLDNQRIRRNERWLRIGDYPCRQTKKGFEFEYYDENGKLRHQELTIVSEE